MRDLLFQNFMQVDETCMATTTHETDWQAVDSRPSKLTRQAFYKFDVGRVLVNILTADEAEAILRICIAADDRRRRAAANAAAREEGWEVVL